ncbi:hypothetical protein ABGV49_02525 [Chromobacterium vaccinii]|uniref:Uncharacterized protein n=1 Tax=Chromobacterium vaccinii TaxID=1108595 RepID=A0ABV0F785_9NEIS
MNLAKEGSLLNPQRMRGSGRQQTSAFHHVRARHTRARSMPLSRPGKIYTNAGAPRLAIRNKS